jgi:cell division septum initiation protein DivIVA
MKFDKDSGPCYRENHRLGIAPIIAAEVTTMQQTLQQNGSYILVSLLRYSEAKVASRRFSRRVFGADPGEVRTFLADTAKGLKQLAGALEQEVVERIALEQQLRDATAERDTLRTEVAAAHHEAAAYHGREVLIARTLLDAQKAAEDLTRSARTRAEDVLNDAGAAADALIAHASTTASETLTAAEARAEEIVRQAGKTAAARLDAVQADSNHILQQAHEALAEVRRAADQGVSFLLSRTEAFIEEWQEFAHSLSRLVNGHSRSLQTLSGLQDEVQNGILTTLHQLLSDFTQHREGLSQALPPETPPSLSPDSPGPWDPGSPLDRRQSASASLPSDTDGGPEEASDPHGSARLGHTSSGRRDFAESNRETSTYFGNNESSGERISPGPPRSGSGLGGVFFWAATGVLSFFVLKRRQRVLLNRTTANGSLAFGTQGKA